MKNLIILFIGITLFQQCRESETLTMTCGMEATVIDLRGVDGCNFLFELNNGTRLQPVRIFYCGTGPLPKEVTEDPLYNFEFVAGKKVRIGYVDSNDYATACMTGKPVKITCLEEIHGGGGAE